MLERISKVRCQSVLQRRAREHLPALCMHLLKNNTHQVPDPKKDGHKLSEHLQPVNPLHHCQKELH